MELSFPATFLIARAAAWTDFAMGARCYKIAPQLGCGRLANASQYLLSSISRKRKRRPVKRYEDIRGYPHEQICWQTIARLGNWKNENSLKLQQYVEYVVETPSGETSAVMKSDLQRNINQSSNFTHELSIFKQSCINQNGSVWDYIAWIQVRIRAKEWATYE